MAAVVVVRRRVNLAKLVFKELLDYHHRTGLQGCELDRIENSLRRAGVVFSIKDIVRATNELILGSHITLDLYRYSSDDKLYNIMLVPIEKTIGPS